MNKSKVIGAICIFLGFILLMSAVSTMSKFILSDRSLETDAYHTGYNSGYLISNLFFGAIGVGLLAFGIKKARE